MCPFLIFCVAIWVIYSCKTFSGGRRLVTILGLGTSDGYVFGKGCANDMMV